MLGWVEEGSQTILNLYHVVESGFLWHAECDLDVSPSPIANKDKTNCSALYLQLISQAQRPDGANERGK